MEREVIVVYTTDEDEENLDPNAPLHVAKPAPTGACQVYPPKPARGAADAAPDDNEDDHLPATLTSEAKELVREKTVNTQEARASVPTSLPIPTSDRGSGRPQKQLCISGVVAAEVSSKIKRHWETSTLRGARQSTTQLRPHYRTRQAIPGHNIPAPPPLRPARMMERIAMTNSTHIVVHQGESLEPVEPPNEIPTLGAQYNPTGIKFQDVSPTKMCACTHPCRVNSCTNAAEHIFCSPMCCPFAGTCGNGLDPSRCLALMKHSISQDYTIVATHPIDAHVVVGEYMGEMTLETFKVDERPKNKGFRLYMHHDPDHPAGARVCIDAMFFGNMLRYINHSCFANTRFRQVCNGTQHTVVVVTNRRLERGEELLVDYGVDLWFYCRCRGRNCIHRGFATGTSSTDDDEAGYFIEADDEMEDTTGSDFEREVEALRRSPAKPLAEAKPDKLEVAEGKSVQLDESDFEQE